MPESPYYRAAEIFRATAHEIKKISATQEHLAMSGLMISTLEFSTSLLSDTGLQDLKFADNSDLFLSGKQRPPSLKFNVTIAVSAKA